MTTEREILSSAQFKKIAGAAEKKINEITALLTNDDSLLNEKGLLLKKEREIWRAMFKGLGLQPNDDAIKYLIEAVDLKI